MVTKLMEGSYYILLNHVLLPYILSIYIATDTTDRCINHTAFLKHLHFRKTMAPFPPDHFFYQPGFSAGYPRTQTRPHPLGQDGGFHVDALCCNHVQTTVSLDQYNVDRTGALCLHQKTTNHSLRTETLRLPTLSNLRISHPSIPAAISDYPILGPAAYNGGDSQDSIIRHGPASSVVASNSVGFQEDASRQPLSAAAPMDLPRPPEFTHRKNLHTYAAPLSDVGSGETGNPTYLTARPMPFNLLNAPYMPPPSQTFFSPSNVDSLRPPQVYDPSNVSIPLNHFPTANPNPLGASEISASINSSNQYYPCPRGTTFNGLGDSVISTHSNTSSPYHLPPDTSNSKVSHPSAICTSSQKSTIRHSKSNIEECNRTGTLSSVATKHLAPEVNVNNIKRQNEFSGRRVINSTGPTIMSNSTEGEHKEQDPFELYTHHYDSDTDEWTVAGFNTPSAPNVDSIFVSGAQESHTGQCCTDHLKVDADSGDLPQPRQKPQRRKKVQQPEKAKAERRHKPQQRNKVQKTERAKAERREQSIRSRRTTPKKRYFCVYLDCKRSEGQGWPGFANVTERNRHHDCHFAKKHSCSLHHVDGKGVKWFARRDGLRKYVFLTARGIFFEKVC